ncbi:MAG TPA: inositol-3-phosphate synthase [Tepidisphaeraceae bacterium]|nr:inositol-3-phosphate synthase [Tepidisphaeraceae bacterium]
MPQRRKVRVAIVGMGNCASALVQGVHFYRNAKANQLIPGLMHPQLGGYHIRDIEFSAAFDVNEQKVGKDVASAILAPPNNTIQFAKVPRTGIKVQRGPTMDGIGKYVKSMIPESKSRPVDVARMLRQTKTDVLISYLPVGSQRATEWYMRQALEAGCGVVNCVPVFIASEIKWRKLFEQHRLPIIGDDVKSQLGATILHRTLTRLFGDRGVRIDRTYQLNCGGNTDFLGMLERERLDSKKISKTQAVTSQLDFTLPAKQVHVGPSDYIPWLDDRKICFIRMEGTTFGNVPLKCELNLEVWDSPNSAGVVIDAVRCIKLAMDRGIGGALAGPSSWLMKSPPTQFSDARARQEMESFITSRANARGRNS